MATPTAQTASQVIKDSLLALNVIRASQNPTADQQALCIRRLNQMMAGWEADGKRLGYIPVGTATDVLTVPDAAILGIVTHLAIYVAPYFGASVSAELAAAADKGMELIDKITCTEVQAATELQPSVNYGSAYNIQTN